MTKLPKPAHCGPSGTGDYFSSYSKDQMLQFRRDALEEAAQWIKSYDGYADSLREEAIRALLKATNDQAT